MTDNRTTHDDQELMAAAVLHDVAEDTAASLDDIRKEFGSRVADIVTQLTDSEVNGLAHDESWQQRKQAAISRLAQAPHDVQVVALAAWWSFCLGIKRPMKAHSQPPFASTFVVKTAQKIGSFCEWAKEKAGNFIMDV